MVFDEQPVKRPGAPRTKPERADKPGRQAGGAEPSHELNLEDLGIDVRSDPPPSRLPAAATPPLLKRSSSSSPTGRPRRSGLVFLGIGAAAVIAVIVAMLARSGRNEAGPQNQRKTTAQDSASLLTKTSPTTLETKPVEDSVTTKPLPAAVPRAGGTQAGTRPSSILARLDEPISVSFPYETPLSVVVRQIKNATNKGGNPGIPIYLDPRGLKEAGKSLTSTVKIDAKAMPLKRSLQQILDQLRLAYVVKDEVLFISSPLGVDREKKDATGVPTVDSSPKTKDAVAELAKPISMAFPNETPLRDLLKYVNQATRSKVYIDPEGMSEAKKTMESTFSIDLEGVPLKTTLRLLLRQLDMTYVVTNGFLLVTSPARASELLQKGRQNDPGARPKNSSRENGAGRK